MEVRRRTGRLWHLGPAPDPTLLKAQLYASRFSALSYSIHFTHL